METLSPLHGLQVSADELEPSVTSLLAELVRIPSRAGIDSCDRIFGCIANWLKGQDVPCTTLTGEDGRVVALAGRIEGSSKSGAFVLNATVDTAGFGDVAAWTRDPVGAEIADKCLYGRGSADAKAGVAIFCHLLAAFRARSFARGLGFVFDADEHSGYFGGMRAWLDRLDEPVAGVLIGYPGHERIGVGARGFWRATLHISGASAHSGSSHDRGTNAVAKASHLVASLAELQREMARHNSEAFPLPPKFTITGIRGGGEFSLVPDGCELELDVRLTPTFTAEMAEARLQAMIERLDLQFPSPTPSRIATQDSVPAYLLPAEAPLAAALSRAGERVLGRHLPLAVTGPSNVGNLLAQRGIPALCGFGVAYRNIHAPDECVSLASLMPTYRIYEFAMQELLAM
jgi:succinyl-diaminopimelate desuccinylase